MVVGKGIASALNYFILLLSLELDESINPEASGKKQITGIQDAVKATQSRGRRNCGTHVFNPPRTFLQKKCVRNQGSIPRSLPALS